MILQLAKIAFGMILGLLALGMAPMWPMLAMIGDAPGSENKALTVMAIAAVVILAIGGGGIVLIVSGIRGLL